MYLPIGGDMAVRTDTVIGIFDLDHGSWSHRTRAFLGHQQSEGAVIPVGDDLPKTFLLTREYGIDRVYLTQFSTATLERRLESTEKGEPNHD